MTEVDAIYSETEHKPWRENPMIAALPEVISGEEFASHVISFPRYDPAVRQLSAHARITALCDCERLFIPFENHLSLHQRMTRMIRVGYENRNPLRDLNRKRLHAAVNEFSASLKYGVAPHEPTTIQGFALTGVSGVGKSTALHAVLRFYPQVIIHREYAEKAINQKQLVWLNLECPSDGSLKSLCRIFFESVDKIMGTTYTKDYFKETHSVSRIVPHFAHVAAMTNLGVLIIDEIQALKAKRSQGAEVMLNFFTLLTNTIGIPVVLIGTPEAKEVLDQALHQIRRDSGQGEMQWGPRPRNQEWNNYVGSLWQYQYIKQVEPLTEELTQKLHQVSFGIVGFATKIFVIAQERAINAHKERITTDLLETVASTDFESAIKKLHKLYRLQDSKSVTQVIPVTAQAEPKRNSKTGSKKKVSELEPESTSPFLQKPIREAPMLKLSKEASSAKNSVYDSLKSGGFTRDARELLE